MATWSNLKDHEKAEAALKILRNILLSLPGCPGLWIENRSNVLF